MKIVLLLLLISLNLNATQLCPDLLDNVSKYVQAATSGERQYEVERPLITYMSELYVRTSAVNPHGPSTVIRFTDDLYQLKSSERWLDLGSGEGLAITDTYTNLNSLKRSLKESRYLRDNPPINEYKYMMEKLNLVKRSLPSPFEERYKTWTKDFFEFIKRPNKEKPFATGVTYEMKRKTPPNAKYEFKTGKLFNEYNNSEFGGTRLITDLYGVYSYVKDINEYFKKVFEILPVGGRVYIKNGHTYVRRPKQLFRSYSEDHESLIDWLKKQAKGIIVYGNDGDLTFIVEKASPTVTIPKLKLVEFKEGKPPMRVYAE